jgi:hypothetical protein
MDVAIRTASLGYFCGTYRSGVKASGLWWGGQCQIHRREAKAHVTLAEPTALHLSSAILGLDPRIHSLPQRLMDPRVKPEDDVEGEAGTRQPSK